MSPETQKTLKRCAKWLARRDLFEREVVERLVDWDTPDAAILGALEYLRERGFLHDERLAIQIAEAEGPTSGDLRLRERILDRSGSSLIFETALASVPAEGDRASLWVASAEFHGMTPERAARKLASRGFDEDTIRSVLESFDKFLGGNE